MTRPRAKASISSAWYDPGLEAYAARCQLDIRPTGVVAQVSTPAFLVNLLEPERLPAAADRWRFESMIHVIATIVLRDGRRDAFLEEFRRLSKIVRDEEGCIEYGPAIDLATEVAPPPRANVVTVVEKWSSVDALQAHLQAPHMARYRDTVRDLVVDVTIQVLQPA